MTNEEAVNGDEVGGTGATPRNALLRHLGRLAAGTGVVPGLGALPEDLLGSLVEEVGAGLWREEDGYRLLRLVARDPRATVRRAVAEAVATAGASLRPRLVDKLLRSLARDPARRVQAAVPRSLAGWLAGLDGLAQAEVVGRWAGAASARVRLALARALAYQAPTFSAELALELFASDPVQEVRRAAATAAAARLEQDPQTYGPVLERLGRDRSGAVRRAVRRGRDSQPPAESVGLAA